MILFISIFVLGFQYSFINTQITLGKDFKDNSITFQISFVLQQPQLGELFPMFYKLSNSGKKYNFSFILYQELVGRIITLTKS